MRYVKSMLFGPLDGKKHRTGRSAAYSVPIGSAEVVAADAAHLNPSEARRVRWPFPLAAAASSHLLCGARGTETRFLSRMT
ncbi:hypothetical protein GCM10010121_092420 [Streptomyces brasiliensis]|uniref:Uncharacterized protein n=1 Tax=Streptomyces brasiliensis TaxID=1954 RepID=A0A917UM51_9ACTN|nr:hypothetical protein GCM10010121_092420 [Streptomyces brasiliensis]